MFGTVAINLSKFRVKGLTSITGSFALQISSVPLHPEKVEPVSGLRFRVWGFNSKRVEV